MKLLSLTLIYLFKMSKSAPSSQLLYTDQACGAEEQVSSSAGIGSDSACETECYNRFLSNGDCSFYSYYSGDSFCVLFSTCGNVGASAGALTYEMSILTDAPTTSPTRAPTGECECFNGGECVDGSCRCVYPYYGSNCENVRDCSSCS